MKFKDMSDKQLIDMASDLYESVEVIECYGSKDVANLIGATTELDERGITMDERKSVVFTKDGIDIGVYDKKGNVVV